MGSKHTLFKTALDMYGMQVPLGSAAFVYDLAQMVATREDGGNLQELSRIEAENEKVYPCIRQWSNGTHAANHQI